MTHRTLAWLAGIALFIGLVAVVALTSPALGPSTPPSRLPAFVAFGIPVGQSQILFVGATFAVIAVIAYRLATRGSRYDRHHD